MRLAVAKQPDPAGPFSVSRPRSRVSGVLGIAVLLARVTEVDGYRGKAQQHDHRERDEDEDRAALVVS